MFPIYTPPDAPRLNPFNFEEPLPWHLLPTGFPLSHMEHLVLLARFYGPQYWAIAQKLAGKGFDVLEPSGASSRADLNSALATYFENRDGKGGPEFVFRLAPFTEGFIADPSFWAWYSNHDVDNTGGNGSQFQTFTAMPRYVLGNTKTETNPPSEVPSLVPNPLPEFGSGEWILIHVTNYLVRLILHIQIAMCISKATSFGEWGGRPEKKGPGL